MDENPSVTIRPAVEKDLEAIARIQSHSPEASQWAPRDYLAFDARVALRDGAVAGFIVARRVIDHEWEILNLAVAPEVRRQGVGRRLLESILESSRGDFYLEVRESNAAARRFYEQAGFELVTKRLQYYSETGESAIVMKFHS